jgi:hypothetical protein
VGERERKSRRGKCVSGGGEREGGGENKKGEGDFECE